MFRVLFGGTEASTPLPLPFKRDTRPRQENVGCHKE
jgi:hypothetical protein